MIVVGFTGTKEGMTDAQKRSAALAFIGLRDNFGEIELHHGDCVGADEEVHYIALGGGTQVILHPPIKEVHRAFCKGAVKILPPKEYLDRNQDIVNASTLLMAAPKSNVEELRSGTWSTVRRARKAGLRIFIFWPDGRVTVEKGKRRESQAAEKDD